MEFEGVRCRRRMVRHGCGRLEIVNRLVSRRFGLRPSAGLARGLAYIGVLGLISVAALAASAAQAREEAPVRGEVAYTRWGARSWISVADLTGAGRHEITQPPGKGVSWDDYGPMWSPDGSWLAFVRKGLNGSASGLYVANRDGTGLRRVLRLSYESVRDLSTEAPDYSWSPDGRRLAFADGPLYIVNRDGTNRRKLVPSSTCIPAWSPDGRSLVYLVDDFCGERGGLAPSPGHRAVDRIDTDGSHRRQLAIGSFGDASWSPDGHQIAFTDGCQVQHGVDWFCSVSLMKTDGSSKRRLVKDSYGGWVEWAAGGKEVLWPSYPASRAANVATGRSHRVLPAGYGAGYPVGMSRDGQRIAVVAAAWSPHPVPLIIVTPSGRLIQKVTVPRGWKSHEVSVYLR